MVVGRRMLLMAGLDAALAMPASAQTRPRFAAAASYSAERSGAAFLVARHGIVLAEHYSAGAPSTRYAIGAGARMFAPLLAASLVEDRLMSLDEPVAMTLGAWGAHPQKALITVRALLSGSSGIAYGRARPQSLEATIALEPVAPVGERFIDDPAPYVLLGEIARRKLQNAGRGADAAAYLTERTLDPIGATPLSFTRDAALGPRFDTGIEISARGWAQAGELIRRDGVFRATTLVDGDVVREARRGGLIDTRAGMGLWLANGARNASGLDVNSDLWRMNPSAPADLAMAAGQGGQRLYIVPSENLVIVRLGRSLDLANWSDGTFLSLISQDL